ncbi:MAG TPA: ATP-binding protein [Luteibaculaceae bacterium]|nr:ATP-binding protein [Luteibaculaceae bacterium]
MVNASISNLQKLFNRRNVVLTAILCSIALISLLSLSLLNKAKKDRFWAEHRRKMEIELKSLQSAVKHAQAICLSELVNRNPAARTQLIDQQQRVRKHLAEAQLLTEEVWSQREEIREMESKINDLITAFDEITTSVQLTQPRKRYLNNRITNGIARIDRGIERMIRYEQSLFKTQTQAVVETENQSNALIAGLGLFSMALVWLAAANIGKQQRLRQREIDAREEAVKARENSEQKYTQLLERSNDAILIHESKRGWTTINPTAADLFGFHRQNVQDLLPAELLAFALSLDAPPAQKIKTTITSASGQVIDAEVSVSRWFTDTTQLTGFILTDITERENALANLDRAVEELKRSNSDLEQFAYVASHDLQEPLRKIQTFVNRFLSEYGESLDSRGSDYLQRAESSAKRMQTLIIDLLAYSRLTRDTSDKGDADLQQICQQITEDLSLAAEEKKARISFNDLPVLHQVNASQIQQLFYNLIHNALKFSTPDRNCQIVIQASSFLNPETSISPLLTPKTEYFKIEVTDNGIGFDMIYIDKIFTIFQRLNGRSEYPGNGIGLAICQKICINHHGAITAYSVPKAGSTFTVYLPKHDEPH